jgi:acyl-coenzyme A synthetase/AMP-(fatty) acid ligase/acyl carrier protein
MIDHRGAVNTILDINSRYGVAAGDRVFALSSLGFDLSVYDIFGPLAVGGAIVMPAAEEALDPAHWIDIVIRERVTIWNSVPALMKLFVEYAGSRPDLAGNNLRLALLSGDWIPLTLPDQIRALAPKAEVISLGGATEASIWSILFPIRNVDPAWKSIPYGRAMVNQSFLVLDKALDDCPVGVIGELYIGGIGLCKGYWNNPQITQASFVTHPPTGARLYRTGDLGRWLPDGNIEFLGREDFQVKIQGLRIELGEIEAILLQHPAVNAAVVTARGERDGPKRLIGYIVPRGRPPAENELRNFLLTKLPDYMVPLAFVPLDALPLTPNGKIDRSALPEPDLIATEATSVAPRNELETSLVKIWQEVFGIERIGVTDDFFDLGGHSLLGMQILSRIARTFGRKLPFSAILQSRNIEKLAAIIRDSGSAPAVSPPHSRIPIQPRGLRPARGVVRVTGTGA